MGAILVLGLGLRLWGISFGLPYLYHADEGVPVNIALNILRTGNLNPGFFHWPSLLFYLNALVYVCYFSIGRITGRFSVPSDLPYPDVEIMGVGKSALPDEFLLGRGLTAVFGALSILLVYLIGAQLNKRKATAWFAALLMAVDTIVIKHSQLIRPDTFAVFFSLLSILFAIKIMDDPRLRNYFFAAISAGLAASSKYNAAIVAVAIIAAHFVRFRWRGLFRRELYIAGLVSALAFFVFTPFAILDAQRFLDIGILDDVRIYSTGHPGSEGDTFDWYAGFLWTTQGFILLLALAEAVAIVIRRERKGIVLLSFPVVYFAFINMYVVHGEPLILLVIPLLFVLAALFSMRAYDYISTRWANQRFEVGAALIALALLVVAPRFAATAAHDARILEWDGREYSRRWIDVNLPAGSRIALEAYSPYVDRHKFVVAAFYGLQDHTADWYVSQGFEYLVFSQGIYQRYFDDPGRYSLQVENYNAFFARFPLVTRFDENSFEIRIYKTGVTLPAHRLAARYGNEGDIIELVGYEDAQGIRGETLVVKLYWRPLRDTREPLELEIQLFDQEDRVVASVRDDLFQHKGWQDNMFASNWTIPVPKDAAPGTYRVQVNVIQTRFSYDLPAFNWAGEEFDRVMLGPFEMK